MRAETDTELRCHSCSHRIGSTAEPVRIVALFKPSQFRRVPHEHSAEVRKRCQSCGWVNVFHPPRVEAPKHAA